MPFALELALDERTGAVVRRLWAALAAAALDDSMVVAGAVPHVSLAVCDSVQAARLTRVVEREARLQPPVPCTFGSLGVFPSTGVVFVAPLVRTELLRLYARVHRRIAPYVGGLWPYYTPAAWVPHCTLAIHTTPPTLPAILEVCAAMPLPLSGQLAAIEVVEFPPVRTMCSFALRGVCRKDGTPRAPRRRRGGD